MKQEKNINALLAARIRLERENRGWSLAKLASLSGVSMAMISKVERGESSPTAALLGRLSGAFALTLSQLFSRLEPTASRLALKNRQLSWKDPQTGYVRRSLTPEGAQTPLQLVSIELPRKTKISYPASAYTFIDQQVLVLEGHLNFIQGTAKYELHSGDCLHLGPPADCTFINPDRSVCRYIVAVVRRD